MKTAYSYIELDNTEKAKEFLDTLVKRYPESVAAAKAKNTIDRLSGQKRKE
ncbi:MAG: tetratricopeptide repeat protein [Deltaproteobacteria bacterium]